MSSASLIWPGKQALSAQAYLSTESPDGIPDIFHVAAQGVIAGANMLLVDMHPEPKKSLVDAQQAITLEELPYFLDDVAIAREAWVKRRALVKSLAGRESLAA